MYVCFAYKNGETKVRRIKRFSDLSTDKSDFYYYEEDSDAWDKEHVLRSQIFFALKSRHTLKLTGQKRLRKNDQHRYLL